MMPRKIGLLPLLLVTLFVSVFNSSTCVQAGPLDVLMDPRISSFVQDTNGNQHYFWVTEDGSVARLYYRVIGPNGLTELDGVLVEQVHAKVRRPQVLVDPRHRIHFLWQERSLETDPIHGTSQIHYALFKLSLESLSLQPLYHRVLSTQGELGVKHPRMALDKRGEVAIVWEEPKTGILLAKLDPTGRGVVPTIIVPGPFRVPVRPTITADSLGRLHIAWVNRSSRKASTSRILYTVVSENRLKPLIRPTTLYRLPQPLKSVSITIVNGNRLELDWSIERAGAIYSDARPDGSVTFELIRKGASSHSSWGILLQKIIQTQWARKENSQPKLVVEGIILRDSVLEKRIAPVSHSLIQPSSVCSCFISTPTPSPNDHLWFSLWAHAPPRASSAI
jgi:hypothetical protein